MISESWLELSMLSAGSDTIIVLQKLSYWFCCSYKFLFTGMLSNTVSIPLLIYY